MRDVHARNKLIRGGRVYPLPCVFDPALLWTPRFTLLFAGPVAYEDGGGGWKGNGEGQALSRRLLALCARKRFCSLALRLSLSPFQKFPGSSSHPNAKKTHTHAYRASVLPSFSACFTVFYFLTIFSQILWIVKITAKHIHLVLLVAVRLNADATIVVSNPILDPGIGKPSNNRPPSILTLSIHDNIVTNRFRIWDTAEMGNTLWPDMWRLSSPRVT